MNHDDLPPSPFPPSPFPAFPPAPDYKDRSAGLIIFGIFTILLGFLASLMLPLLLLGQHQAARTGGAANTHASLLFVGATYGVLAVALVWLGIGSIMKRRWARDLLLIFSWAWLGLGVLVTIMFAVFIPRVFSGAFAAASAQGHPGQTAQLPQGAATAAILFTLLFVGFVFILMPAVWVFFYSSRHVRATVQDLDPVSRWTDACPLPVLALSLFMAFSASLKFIMPFTYHGFLPCFGMLLSGTSIIVYYSIYAICSAYAAWNLFRVRLRGWWTAFALMNLGALSSVITYSRHSMEEIQKLNGYSDAQIARMTTFISIFSHNFKWFACACILPVIVYMLCTLKYFIRSPRPVSPVA